MRLLAADCFLMPSRYEGLPIAGIEAVGAGLPCVFTEIAPLQELRAPVALWVPVNAFEALAEQMGKLVVGRPMPAEAETEEFRRLFSIARTADMYTRAYLERRTSAVSREQKACG
jgi:glycosyltransferase involved in cell wall biosynthesis